MFEDDVGAKRVAPWGSRQRLQFEVEGSVERWGVIDIKATRSVAFIRENGVDLDAIDPQIPKVRKLTNEIKDLVVISPR